MSLSLLTPKQVAAALNCKQSSVYSWAKAGQIPAYKLNGLLRFSQTDIDAWIQKNKINPAQVVTEKATSKTRRTPLAKNLDIDRLVKGAIDSSKYVGVPCLLTGNQAQVETLGKEA